SRVGGRGVGDPQGGAHAADGLVAPIVIRAFLLAEELFPQPGVTSEKAIDGAGAGAAPLFVVEVVPYRIGMAEDGERRLGMSLAQKSEQLEFLGGVRADE